MSQKVAIVTGATSGLGRAIAFRLLENGYFVIGTGRSQNDLDTLGAVHLSNFMGISGDIASSKLQVCLLAAAEEKGRLDLLVNNAGIGHISELVDFPIAKALEIIQTNVSAPTELTIRALPLLKKSAGTLLNISSTLGHFSTPYNSVYSASKHYLNGLSRGLRMELRGSGARVITACPFSFQSGFVKRSLAGRNAALHYLEFGDSAELIAERILRRITRNKLWLFPTFNSWLLSFAGSHFQGISDLFLGTIVEKRTRTSVDLEKKT